MRLLNSFLLIAVLPAVAWAQCAMCKANVANAENSTEAATSFNNAILVMLVPTLTIIGGLVKMILKYRHLHHENHVNLRSPDTQRDAQ